MPMKKKFIIGLIVIIIGIVLIGGYFNWSNYRQIGKLEYTVIELPEADIFKGVCALQDDILGQCYHIL